MKRDRNAEYASIEKHEPYDAYKTPALVEIKIGAGRHILIEQMRGDLVICHHEVFPTGCKKLSHLQNYAICTGTRRDLFAVEVFEQRYRVFSRDACDILKDRHVQQPVGAIVGMFANPLYQF